MTDAQSDHLPADHWQRARQAAGELLPNLPTPAPGTAIYICTEGIAHPTLVLLRAFVRAAERGGQSDLSSKARFGLLAGC
jgi:hypothetical protein